MAHRDYHALMPGTWTRSGINGSPSAQETFLASNYSLIIIGAGAGTTRVQDLITAAGMAGTSPELAWYTKACGLHDPGAAAETETSYGWATMSGRNALARASYPSGLAITNRWNGWRYVDIVDAEGSGNNTAWIASQNDLIDSMQARVDVGGVYLDNSSVMIVTGSNSFTVNPSGNAAAPGGYTDAAWYAAIKAIVDGVASAQTGKHVWFNSYTGFGAVGQRGLSLLQNSYGMFSEGFSAKIDGTGTPGHWTRDRFKQQVDDVITALASYGGRYVVVIDDCNSDDYQRRMFKLGAYLLAYNNTVRLKEMTRTIDTTSELDYCREYDSALDQLGAPSAAYTDDGTFLLRPFVGGRVIVNPSDTSYVYTVPDGVWEQLDVVGTTSLGGNVPYWGVVGRTVVMPAYSALVIRQVGGVSEYTISSGGLTRRYSIYLPTPLPAGRIPAVMMLHGGYTNSNFARVSTDFDTVADANGFAVIYPDGTPDGEHEFFNGWGDPSSPVANIDDVAFLRSVITDAASHAQIDRGSIYVTGISNGAKMASRLAASVPSVVAGLASVAGGVTTLDDAGGAAVPYLHIHGESDPTCPYTGGPGDIAEFENFPNLNVETQILPYWATRNGGTLTPTTTTPTGYTKKDYTDAGVTTWLYKVTSGIHQWDFGGTPNRDANLPGGSTQAAIWAFMSGRYRAPVASLTRTPTSGAYPLAVTLSGDASASLDGVLEYAFDTGSGSFGSWQSGATAGVTFLTVGTKTCRLKVRDWAQRESAIVSVSVVVSVPDPTPDPGAAPAITFTSNKASVRRGGWVSLAWSTERTTTVTASGDWRGTLPTSATGWIFFAWRTSDLILTATGPGGTATAKVRITVSTRTERASILGRR